jgi:DNA-binding transcriptional LysR family regulator
MNLKTVDLNLLISFDALMSHRNVSRAAEQIGVTQSALSHALKRLRILLGDPLLRRGPRGMEPTERALSLRDPVKAVLAEIHSIVSTRITFDPATTQRTFKLSMSDAMNVEALPLIMRNLRKAAPNIDLLVTTSGPRAACVRILNDEVELAIGVFPHVPAEILRRELYRDVLVCVADKNNPRLKGGRMDEKSYLESPHVTVAPNLDSGVQLDEIFTAMGFPRRIVATVPHYTAVPGLVRGTDLVAHTRRRLINVLRTAANLVVFPIPAPFRVPDLCFEQIWHPRHERDAGHRWLRQLITNSVGMKRGSLSLQHGAKRSALSGPTV